MLIERMRRRLAADTQASLSPASRPQPTSPRPASNWIHEIKHDGFRLMARRDPVGIRLITRRGNDWTQPLPAGGRGREPPQGAVLPDRRRGGVLRRARAWLPFQLLRHRRNEPQAFLYAFDLLELDGADLRREPIEVRKATWRASFARADRACD